MDSTKLYAGDDALSLVKEFANAKFDGPSMWLCNWRGCQKSDQVVRGAVVLPHGTGKTKRAVLPKAPRLRSQGCWC